VRFASALAQRRRQESAAVEQTREMVSADLTAKAVAEVSKQDADRPDRDGHDDPVDRDPRQVAQQQARAKARRDHKTLNGHRAARKEVGRIDGDPGIGEGHKHHPAVGGGMRDQSTGHQRADRRKQLKAEERNSPREQPHAPSGCDRQRAGHADEPSRLGGTDREGDSRKTDEPLEREKHRQRPRNRRAINGQTPCERTQRRRPGRGPRRLPRGEPRPGRARRLP